MPTLGEGSGRSDWCLATSSAASAATAGARPGGRRGGTTPRIRCSPPAFRKNSSPRNEATTEAEGTVDDLRARLDAILDLSADRLAGLPNDRLELGARWSGFPVTVGFRLGRWGSHIREHSIQVEKTFAMLGHVPTEPARLARLVLAAYGRAESVVFGRQGVDDAVDRVVKGAAEARDAVRSAGRAAGVTD